MKIISWLFVFQLWAAGGLEVDWRWTARDPWLREDNIDIWNRMLNLSSPGERSESSQRPSAMFRRLEDQRSLYSLESLGIIQSCSGSPGWVAPTLTEVSEEDGSDGRLHGERQRDQR